MEELWSTTGIAETLGLRRQTVEQWKLPEPDFIVGRIRAWRPATVRQWAREHRPDLLEKLST